MGYDAADDQPSLRGARAKVERAEAHVRLFETEWQQLTDSNAYTFLHEVHADGLNHRYRAEAVPALDTKWALMLGDCVHNLRAALDHLVYELVRANGGQPDAQTHFPVHIVPGGVRVPGGVAAEALRLIEEVQPYTESDESIRIQLIARLDDADRQHDVVLSPAASGRDVIVDLGKPRPAPDIVKMWTSDRPLESGKTVHGYTYITPHFGEDPNVKVVPHVLVEDSFVETHFGRTPVPVLLGDKLVRWVSEKFLPRFDPFFS